MRTSKPTGKAWREWPTKVDVVRDYGITAAQLGALVRHGHLVAYACSDRSVRFDPLQLAAAFQTDAPSSDEPAEAAVPGEPKPDAAATMATVMARVLHELATMLKDCRESLVRITEASVKPMQQGLEFYERAIAAQDSRMQRLEQGWLEGILAREQSLTQQHERTLLEKQLTADHEVRQQALTFAINLAPQVLLQWKMGKAAQEALDFLMSIDDSLLEAAGEMGFAPKEKIDSLRTLRAKVKEQRAKEAAKQAAESQSEPSPPRPRRRRKKSTGGSDSPPANGAGAPTRGVTENGNFSAKHHG